jgi:hypothetical protein
VTVLAAGSVTIPFDRSQVLGWRAQASPPTTPRNQSRWKVERNLKPRSIEARTSSGLTTWPVE